MYSAMPGVYEKKKYSMLWEHVKKILLTDASAKGRGSTPFRYEMQVFSQNQNLDIFPNIFSLQPTFFISKILITGLSCFNYLYI